MPSIFCNQGQAIIVVFVIIRLGPFPGSREIEAGEELTVPYGPSYWFDDEYRSKVNDSDDLLQLVELHFTQPELDKLFNLTNVRQCNY